MCVCMCMCVCVCVHVIKKMCELCCRDWKEGMYSVRLCVCVCSCHDEDVFLVHVLKWAGMEGRCIV